MSSQRKGNRVTREQLITMLDYLAANPGLAEGRTKSNITKKEEQRKWEEMQAMLHAADGPEKTVPQWQVVWRDLKSRTNVKVKECRYRMSKGEDISANSTFTDLELRVVDILGAEDSESSKDKRASHSGMGLRNKRPVKFEKYEPVDDDSFDDPLTMQNLGEEEYVEDEEYDDSYSQPPPSKKLFKSESFENLPSKKLKPSNYAAVAQAIHNPPRSSLNSRNSVEIAPERTSLSHSVSQSIGQTQHVQQLKTSFADLEELQDCQEIQATVTDMSTIQANAMIMQAEAAKTSAEAAKICAEAAKMNAEAAKMHALAVKANTESLNKIADAIRLAAEAMARRYDM